MTGLAARFRLLEKDLTGSFAIVVVVDDTTITANVTVPKKAKIGSVWDVRVGSGVLVGGFTVR